MINKNKLKLDYCLLCQNIKPNKTFYIDMTPVQVHSNCWHEYAGYNFDKIPTLKFSSESWKKFAGEEWDIHAY